MTRRTLAALDALCITLTVIACSSQTADADTPDACPVPLGGDAALDDAALAAAESALEDATAPHDAGADARTCPVPAGRIVAAGDSLTHGQPDPDAGGYPAQLAQMIGRPVENLGIDGARCFQMPELTPPAGTVILACGTNDVRIRVNAPAVFRDIEPWVTRQRAHGWRVVVLPIMRFGGTVETDLFRVELNAMLTASYGAASYYDDRQLGDRADPHNAELYSDPIHLTAAGYRLRAGEALRALQRCP